MKNNRALATIITVFFFWGFVAASNTVLIGLFKKNFELSQFQSQLVDSAFYAAYFIGSLIYFQYSARKGDPLNRIGYKKGLITGLCISAIGALGFIPAGYFDSFVLMLLSLFIVALGFTLQQIVANPYAIALGDPATGSHRVSFASGINSFGTTIGPLLLALAIYGGISGSASYLVSGSKKNSVDLSIERTSNKSETVTQSVVSAEEHAGSSGAFIFTDSENPDTIRSLYRKAVNESSAGLIYVESKKTSGLNIPENIRSLFPVTDKRTPLISISGRSADELKSMIGSGQPLSLEVQFFGVGAVILPSIILCFAFLLCALILGLSELPKVESTEKMERDFGALRFPQVIYGMIAIFVYVGTEVAIQSNLPEYMKKVFDRDTHTTVHFISLYWGGLMIGRLTGSLAIFRLSAAMRKIMTVLVPLLAFGIVLFVNYLKGSPMDELIRFTPFVLLLIVAFFVTGEKPAFSMTVFGGIAAVMIAIGLLIQSEWSLYCLISAGLFCSVMWPYIFGLSMAGLGKYTSQGSSLLIMMILGGALLPPLQGFIGDFDIRISYIVPMLGFLYLGFYGWKMRQVLRKQQVDYEVPAGAGH